MHDVRVTIPMWLKRIHNLLSGRLCREIIFRIRLRVLTMKLVPADDADDWESHELRHARHVVELIEAIVADEANSLTINCPNPEFHGLNRAIEVRGRWTGYRAARYEGNTLVDALESAMADKMKTDGSAVPLKQIIDEVKATLAARKADSRQQGGDR